MREQPFIPPATQAKLASTPIPGQRHTEAMAIAISLIGQQVSPNAVLAQLRDKYPSDVTDDELRKVVEFAVSAKPQPIGTTGRVGGNWMSRGAAVQPEKPKRSPEEQARWWLGGVEVSEHQFIESSPVAIPSSLKQSAVTMLELLYGENEFINIVCRFKVGEDGKANPSGGGKTMTRLAWCDWIGARQSVPFKEAGAWIRPNPGGEVGTGIDGAYKDCDILDYRFMLVESDVLPLDLQLAFYSKLKLPIALVVSSGGKSVHAWIWIGAKKEEEYRRMVGRILTALQPFGFDEGNKNPSRLSRLAGAHRSIGSVDGHGIQKLMYLNPKPVELIDGAIIAFEESLLIPALQDKPLQQLFRDAVDRYEDLYRNQGKLGVPTGMAKFDYDTGGIKPGHFIVIAAETGGGKSTLALNWVNHAIHMGIGVAMFSIEMDRDEICDNLVSMNLSIDRNKFNTGRFEESDFTVVGSGLGHLSTLPLWIFDEAIMTIDTIRKTVLQLKNENRIGLAVVDYLQLITPTNTSDNREQQVAAIANGLRAVGKDSRVPIVALSQLNEEGKIRESRVIAHAANVMIILESLRGEDGPPAMKVVKGRRVRLGRYELMFEADFCRLKSAPLVVKEDVPLFPNRKTHPKVPHND